MQVPLRHAYEPKQRFVPVHAVLSCTFPMSTHTDVPVAHDVSPVWHCCPVGVHCTFAAHATQEPLLQTMLLPQIVPSATAFI